MHTNVQSHYCQPEIDLQMMMVSLMVTSQDPMDFILGVPCDGEVKSTLGVEWQPKGPIQIRLLWNEVI